MRIEIVKNNKIEEIENFLDAGNVRNNHSSGPNKAANRKTRQQTDVRRTEETKE